MPNNVTYFAVHADDIDRAQRFYSTVFAWRFEPWGPPGYFLVHTGTEERPGIEGALVQRTEPLAGDGCGYECTISVDSIDETRERLLANGATIVYDKFEITGVGTLVKFKDTEGNTVCAMQYDAAYPVFGR